MKSAVCGMVSGGLSGFSVVHADVGGYPTALQCPVRKGGGVAVLGPEARLTSVRSGGGFCQPRPVLHPRGKL